MALLTHWRVEPFSDEQHDLQGPRQKHEASLQDVLTLLQHGVPSSQFRFKNPRDRLQLVALIDCLAFTAARGGEILVSRGYEKVNECVKYKHLKFGLKKEHGRRTLHLDLTIRNLKGSRTDQEVFRIQTLYEDHELPVIADPAVIRLLIALEDNALSTITSEADLDLIPDHLFRNGFVDLDLHDSIKEEPVLKRPVWSQRSQEWELSKDGIAIGVAHSQLREVRRAASVPTVCSL